MDINSVLLGEVLGDYI